MVINKDFQVPNPSTDSDRPLQVQVGSCQNPADYHKNHLGLLTLNSVSNKQTLLVIMYKTLGMNPRNSKNLLQLSHSLIRDTAFAFRAFHESCSSHPSALTLVKNVISLLPLALFLFNFHSPLKDHLKFPHF